MDLRNYFSAKPKPKAGGAAPEEKPKVEPEKKRTSARKKTVIPDSDEDEEEPVDVKQTAEEPIDPKAFFASAKTKKTQPAATIESASASKTTQPKAKKEPLKVERAEETKEKTLEQEPVEEVTPVKHAKKANDDDYFEDDSDTEIVLKPKQKQKQKAAPTKAKTSESESVKAPSAPKKAVPKGSNSRKRKGRGDDEDDDEDEGGYEDNDGYKDEEEEEVKPAKRLKATAKKIKDDSAMDVDESVEEKPKPKFNFWAHKNKAGPSALGSKEIPQGQDNCLAGWTFVFTGELSSITREDAADLVKRYSGRVTGSPSGKTSFVIVGDDAGQSKLDKVKKLKIKTLNEDEFLDLIRTSPAKTEDGKIVQASSSKSSNNTSRSDSSKVKAEPAASSSTSNTTVKSSETVKAVPPPLNTNGPTQSELWTTKYRPMQVKDLCGNNAQIQKLQRWLEGWEDNYKLNFKKDNADKSGVFRAVLISGPPGIGKTSAAHLVGNSLGFNIVEFNASDTRSKKSLDDDVRVLLDNQSLAGYFQSDAKVDGKGKVASEEVDLSMAKRQLIIMDEVDGMAGGDRGGIAQLITFIKKTHRPQVNQVRSRLMSILHREGRKIPANVLDKLVSGSQSDIRQVLNMLSTWSLTKQEMNYDEGAALSKASEKYVALNPFKIAEQLLVETNYRALSVADKFDMYFNDYQLAPLMIQENYVRMDPTNARGDPHGIEAIELMSKAADSLSDADLVDTMIHGSAQHWSLMPTHAAFSCVRPSFFVHGSMRPGSGGQFGPMMQFPLFLGQYSKSAKYNRMVKELQIRMRLKISGDKNEVRQSYLPALFPALTKPLLRDGVDAIPELIEFMDSYYLSKEDWDSVLELGIGRNDGKKVMDNIPSTTKSAFTRKYNSEVHPQPFLKPTVATRARGGDNGRGEEVPDNLDVVEADAAMPEEVNEADEVAEEESIEKDSNIKQKKTKTTKAKSKGKASSSRNCSNLTSTMNINGLFAHTLTDLIRGIRQNKKNEQSYIAKEIADIRLELRRNDPDLKAQAIAKLTYLQMMGYDMSWASFHVVEVMSSPKFLYKGIGYLGAVQSFSQETDVLMLTTNLIKKDLASSNASEIGIAINGLSHILTPDLARDLCADLVAMLNHSRPIVRKKVLLVLYKVFLKYPEGLRLSFSRMKDRLEDPDPSVVSAAVNVICELARRNPKNYLSLAPQLFKLLTTSSNNWMLIKIIKLFAALTPYEPRLTKKLLPPITSLIQTTPAMSLLYECIHTVIAGGMLITTGSGSNAESANNLATTCVTKLRTFLEDPDQNLKYIGLLALTKILPTHPHLVGEHKDIILKCIDDPDISIRMRALDLIVGMANKKNLTEIVKRLISHLLPAVESEHAPINNGSAMTALMDPVYRADIIRRIVSICSQNSYANVGNFEWYLAVLSDLTNVAGVNVGGILMQQFMDVGVRVKSVRSYTVQLMMRLLADTRLTEPDNPENANSMVLLAAAWLTGEYCSLLESPENALELLSQKPTAKLDPAIQATYLQSMLKIFAYWMNSLQYSWNEESRQSLVETTDLLREGVKGMFAHSPDLEVQERSSNVSVILDIIAEHVPRTPLKIENSISFAPTMPKPPSILGSLYPLFFNQELNPVAPKAQKKVPVPEGLDLEAWIHEPVPEPESESSDEDDFLNENSLSYGYGWSGEGAAAGKSKKKGKKGRDQENSKESTEAKAKRKAERRERQKHDPYYIGGDDSPKSQKKGQEDLDVDSIPIVQLNMDGFEKPIVIGKKSKSGSKKKSKRKERSRSPPIVPVEFAMEEMPEDATQSASDDEIKKAFGAKYSGPSRGILDQDTSALHSVDLSIPVGEDEHLPRAKPYMKPEEVRQYEDELAQRRRREALQAKKDKKEKKESKKSKSSKKDSADVEGKKKKSSKKSKSKEEPLIVMDAPIVEKSPKPERPKSVEPVVEAPPKAKSKKDSNKTGAKSKKTPSTKKSSKAPVAVEFPERADVELALNDNIALTYDITLAQSSVETPATPGSEPTTDPAVSIKFRVHNRNLTQPISSVRVVLADSFDVRLGGSHAGQDIVTVSSSVEPQSRSELALELLILGRIRYELRVLGTLFYEVNGHEESLDFNFAVPPSTFMLAIPRLTGADFSKILTEQLASFSATSSVTVQLSADTTGQDELFWDAVEKVTKDVTHTHVVEVVDGAASFFGQSWQGYQVAGLIKVRRGDNQVGEEGGDGGSKTIEVEMKCTDQSFVDGLAQEILAVNAY
ncbi:AP-3 complex subunit delta [Mortierella sp. AM989]|nr:AP-3 complex subunit delta [Mortierella sp. AM989]